ncbi:unnamed protein product [Symbiodinium sp. KB8]|nr:unnamed protein product [Symbiodinium sp. KB8]
MAMLYEDLWEESPETISKFAAVLGDLGIDGSEVTERVFWLGEEPIGRDVLIIVEGSAAGSDNLESVFADNLTRIGRMVAILDTWKQPVYLRRVWTVYEQFIASTLEIPVVFAMPEASVASVRQQILRGEGGITEVTESMKNVNSASAEAWDPKDETKVKREIQRTVGFSHVDDHVKQVMIQWIGQVVRKEFRELIAHGSKKLANRRADWALGANLGCIAQLKTFRQVNLMAMILFLLCLVPVGALRAFRNHSEMRAAVLKWADGLREEVAATYGEIAQWNVSAITSMRRLFQVCRNFNDDISSWNTSAVTDMGSMFYEAKAFNQPIGSWDTSAVTDMGYMFQYAEAFNHPIGSWDTSAVTDMRCMFADAWAFNQLIGSWDTSAVTNMRGMFYRAKAFNKPIVPGILRQ